MLCFSLYELNFVTVVALSWTVVGDDFLHFVQSCFFHAITLSNILTSLPLSLASEYLLVVSAPTTKVTSTWAELRHLCLIPGIVFFLASQIGSAGSPEAIFFFFSFVQVSICVLTRRFARWFEGGGEGWKIGWCIGATIRIAGLWAKEAGRIARNIVDPFATFVCLLFCHPFARQSAVSVNFEVWIISTVSRWNDSWSSGGTTRRGSTWSY